MLPSSHTGTLAPKFAMHESLALIPTLREKLEIAIKEKWPRLLLMYHRKTGGVIEPPAHYCHRSVARTAANTLLTRLAEPDRIVGNGLENFL